MTVFQLPKTSFKIDWSWIGRLETVLKKQFKIKQSVSIALVSQTEIRNLNKRYRGKDQATDVLTFNLGDTKDDQLGEIIICWPILQRQAKVHGNSLKQELQLLTVHGVLHLMGYEHDKQKDAVAMRSVEANILKKL